jgi:hypothetical protein
MEQSSSEINNSLASQAMPHISWNHSSQEPITCPYSEPDKNIKKPTIIFFLKTI